MRPEFDGIDLFNAVCTVKMKKYRVTTIYSADNRKITFRIEKSRHSIGGEFIFDEVGERPVEYSIGDPITEHKPIDTKISLSNGDKQRFVEEFISFRLSRL